MTITFETIFYNPFLFTDWIKPSIEKHVLNSVFIILNILITAMPVNLLHFYHPIIFGFIYMIFNLTYQGGGAHQAIYPIFDWTNQLPTAILLATVLVFFTLQLFHLFYFIQYKNSCMWLKLLKKKKRIYYWRYWTWRIGLKIFAFNLPFILLGVFCENIEKIIVLIVAIKKSIKII